MSLIDYYNYVFLEIRDPRVDKWPFMSSPFVPLGIIAIYFIIIYGLLPSYMSNKRPYNLKTTIAVYNIFQVVSCVLIIYGVATSGWTTHYTFGCQPADFSEDKMAVRMATYVWWTMLLKMAELIETVFFVLRKKYNQVSPLHVYHHVSTFLISWLVAKFYPGGMLTFNILLNSFVHILMYTYYFLSVLGPETRKKLEPIKSKLTIVQIIQLLLLFFHMGQALLPGCTVPNITPYIQMPNILVNIYLFLKFYLRHYVKHKIN